jgi:hypothetical protein
MELDGSPLGNFLGTHWEPKQRKINPTPFLKGKNHEPLGCMQHHLIIIFIHTFVCHHLAFLI